MQLSLIGKINMEAWRHGGIPVEKAERPGAGKLPIEKDVCRFKPDSSCI
jgi:hypothetical protein